MLKAGSIVECEPSGLLEQDEDGDIDHKVLAAISGQNVELGRLTYTIPVHFLTGGLSFRVCFSGLRSV
jgi:hypothetical protein